ncbi:legumain-like [Chanos chanos]|uniref:legumain n=1 Tax=Chanos chanos TaxID=29144 RepID=A0A6J2VFN0_CHACN|nr:legumain-like [Chanos chanos]
MGGGNSKSGKQWVLLAAGSKGWDNYRHQADVCHAYQMAHQNGIPDEQIVVMMYDDIAYHEENPYHGNIINEPNGPNVYPGVLKDYTRQDVSAENFLAVLQGNEGAVRKRGPKKVIKSDCNDTIFVYLSDHGSTGMFHFIDSTLYVADLIDTLREMASNQQFSQMVIYMESCYSGSVLNKLPGNIKVYGISASNPYESSFACWYDNKRNAYLADAFSALWLHHTKMSDLEKSTLQDQFKYLRRHVPQSTPCQYGDMEISQLPICTFLGISPPDVRDFHVGRDVVRNLTDVTASHNVPLRIQENRIQRERDPWRRETHQRRYKKLCANRSRIERAVQEIAQCCCPDGGATGLSERNCLMRVRELKEVAEHFRVNLFDWHNEEFEYALSHMHVLANLCESGVEVRRFTP